MFCPECHQFNPDNNRFCGMCGHELEQKPVSHYPREGFDDISDIDPRIPANEYAPPRETVSANEPEVPIPHAAERVDTEPPGHGRDESRPRASTSIFDLEPRESEKPKFDTDPRSVKPITYGTNMFEYDPVAAERSNTGVHGPSFLGLSDPDFLDEIDEPHSHARRNWLVFALLVVIGVAVVEWRNIRETGMQYAGTIHLSLPKKGGGQAKITPEQAARTASGETSAVGEGKPEIVVGPTNNEAQKPPATNSTPTPAQSTSNTSETRSATPDKEISAASGAGLEGSDSKKSETASAGKKPAENAAASKDESADTSATDNTEPTAPPAKSARFARRANKRASKSRDESASAAGAEDLLRAEHASDPITAANWLWAATKKGNTEAPVRLADYYANGRGVPKDCEQATVLLRSSARRANPRACARLGMYYATGQCVAQDRAQAWHWLSLAHQADPGSDWIEQYRRRLWSQMTADERARSKPNSTASE